jgi:pimeloyl-ACP methyl ester carboxylesterase
VQQMHLNIASGPSMLGEPLAAPARVLTEIAYAPVLGITRFVGRGIDQLLTELSPLLGDSMPGTDRDNVLAVLCGVVGDHLEATRNPLAVQMQLRFAGAPLTLTRDALERQIPQPTAKLLVLLHGSSMSSHQWSRAGHDHGAALAAELGYTAVYLNYNSGLHISENGQALAALLERLHANWPTKLTEICLLGHSMGGLVARSAADAGTHLHHQWRNALRQMVFLGSPHHGSPLERTGNLVDTLLGLSKYSAPIARLARLRSAGVTDLRFGNTCAEDWTGTSRFAWSRDKRKPLPLPADVQCFAIAGALTNSLSGKWLGDGLVPVQSALGIHAHAERTLGFARDQQWVARGVRHLDLLSDAGVYAQLRDWLR